MTLHVGVASFPGALTALYIEVASFPEVSSHLTLLFIPFWPFFLGTKSISIFCFGDPPGSKCATFDEQGFETTEVEHCAYFLAYRGSRFVDLFSRQRVALTTLCIHLNSRRCCSATQKSGMSGLKFSIIVSLSESDNFQLHM